MGILKKGLLPKLRVDPKILSSEYQLSEVSRFLCGRFSCPGKIPPRLKQDML